jgi:hypothetical protein
MDKKPKLSPNGTYVFDEDDIEQLDELSLTSVVKGLTETTPEDDPEPKSSGAAAPSDGGDTTINAILRSPPKSDDQQPGFLDEPDPAETDGDLIDPELMFPELKPERRR